MRWKNQTPTRRELWSGGMLALVCAASAWADTGDNAADSGHRELPTVVVTAQKIAQTVEQVPASVTSLDGEFIQSIGAFDFTELQNYSSNVTLAISSSAAQVSVRGLGTPDSNPGFDPSVGTVVDGVYYGRSSFLMAFFHDIDRFEVLRGPQGTLFGKNSTAGLLNLVTREPEQEFGLHWEFLTAGYGEQSFRPVLSLPVSDGLSFRLAGNYSRSSHGVLYNTLLKRPERDPQQNTTRMRLSYTPADSWKLDVGGFVSQQRMNYNIFKLSHLTDAMLALVQQYDPKADTNIRSRNNSADVPSMEDALVNGINATVEHDLGGFWGVRNLNLTATTATAELLVKKRDLDADFSPVPFIRDTLVNPSPFQQISQELRLAGDHPDFLGYGHGFSFVGGLSFYRSTFSSSDYFAIEDLGAAAAYVSAAQAGQQNQVPGGAAGTISGQLGAPISTVFNAINSLPQSAASTEQAARVWLNQRATSYAAFGQFEHFFTEHWAFIGGMRYGVERKLGDTHSRATGQQVPGGGAVPANPATSQIPGNPLQCGVSLISQIADQCDHDTNVDRTEHDVSPKIGFKWSPEKRTSAYLTWTRGFKSGGFNALPLNSKNLEYGPERASSYELGAKTRLLEGAMNLSAAVFSTDFDDLQISSFQNNSFVILNAASARSQGFDFDMRWLPPILGTSVNTSLGYTNAHYKSYPQAPAPADSGNSSQDLSGKPLAFAPRWTASLVPAYSRNLDGLGVVTTFAVDLLYRSSRYLDVDIDNRKLQPATTQINARAVVGSGSDRNWALTLAAQNVTDRLVLDQVVGQPLAPGNFAAVRTDHGRYYTANLVYDF